MLELVVCLACAAAAVVPMGLAWAASLPLRDASIADVAWGPTVTAVAWTAYASADGNDRSLLIAVLVSLWGARIALHIGVRNLGHGEDRRYAALRERDGERFPLRSLWSIFGIQAGLAWVVGLPAQSAAADGSPAGLGVVAITGAAVALAGLACETVADIQLRRFLARPDAAGRVMDRGVWRYSRHPNYFGDALFWWGAWLVALEAGSPAWTAIGPLVMTILLLRVSGVSLLETTIGERRPGYAEYARRTSVFVPRPPR